MENSDYNEGEEVVGDTEKTAIDSELRKAFLAAQGYGGWLVDELRTTDWVKFSDFKSFHDFVRAQGVDLTVQEERERAFQDYRELVFSDNVIPVDKGEFKSEVAKKIDRLYSRALDSRKRSFELLQQYIEERILGAGVNLETFLSELQDFLSRKEDFGELFRLGLENELNNI